MIRSGLASRFVLSPNVGPRRDNQRPDMLLLHYTGMDDAERACEWLCDPKAKVSCHYLIDEKGVITQMVDEGLRAWHAGTSSWKGDEDINSCAVGIEIQNPGHAAGYPDFPQAQMMAVVALCREIVARHEIPGPRVLAHSDVAPLRKIDPGEKFDWALLHAQGIGHWVHPEPITGGPFLQLGDAGQSVEALQVLFRKYGYGIEITGAYDPLTQAVVRAFQRHFRPALVDGVADTSTVATLHRLLTG
jgi:N-acetylmuramoyl-L-alanine amidase